jgi:hypothetical protein
MSVQHCVRTLLAVLLLALACADVPAAAAPLAEVAWQAPSFDGSVYAVAHAGDTVFVGGSFTAAVAGRPTDRPIPAGRPRRADR